MRAVTSNLRSVRLWLIAILVIATGGWMAFDGAYALLAGDFITPRSGEYAGQLGPWASLLRSLGVEPRSIGVKVFFLLFGLTYVAALGAFLVWPRRSWVGLAACAAIALLFLPLGTFASLVVLVLLSPLRPRRAAALLLLGALAALGSGCLIGSALEATGGSPAGSAIVDGAALGHLELAPTACQSGERQLFMGVDFLDGRGFAARLILEPAGAANLRFFSLHSPLEEGIVFRRADCPTFELSLERNGWRINDVYDLRVSLRFDCHAPTGDTATGALSADHCH